MKTCTVMMNAMLARLIKYTESKNLSKMHQPIYLEKSDKDWFSIDQPYASPFY